MVNLAVLKHRIQKVITESRRELVRSTGNHVVFVSVIVHRRCGRERTTSRNKYSALNPDEFAGLAAVYEAGAIAGFAD